MGEYFDSAMKTAKILCSLPFIAFCTVGLFIQCSYLTEQYFRYGTRTQVEIKLPDFVVPPHISFCGRVSDILKADLIRQKFGPRPLARSTKDSKQDEYDRILLANLTLRDMFDMSPSADEVLMECLLRLPGSYLLQAYSGEKCNQLLHVRRYFTQQFMCYMMGPNVAGLPGPHQFDFVQLSQADFGKGLVYSLVLNRSLVGRALLIMNIIHGADPPTDSRYFAKLTRTRIDFIGDQQVASQNNFVLSYSVLSYDLLPQPYVTNCGHNNGLKDTVCRKKCLSDLTVSKYNKLPFNWLIEDTEKNIEKKLLTFFDLLANETAHSDLISFINTCKAKCSKPSCHNTRYNTETMDTTESPPNDTTLELNILLPQFPSINIEHVAVYELNDYVLLIMSCLGTWLGVSMLDFNPGRLFNSKDTKEAVVKQGSKSSARENNELRKLIFAQSATINAILMRLNQLDNKRPRAQQGRQQRRFVLNSELQFTPFFKFPYK